MQGVVRVEQIVMRKQRQVIRLFHSFSYFLFANLSSGYVHEGDSGSNGKNRSRQPGNESEREESNSSIQPSFPPTLFLCTSADNVDDVTAAQWQHKWIGIALKIVLSSCVEEHTVFCLKKNPIA